MRLRLMTPGPTALLEQARLAMSGPIVHHRTEEFRAVVRECREGLRAFFRTQGDVAILTMSGTGGMESVVVNLLSPGDRVLVGSCGKFGDRWADIATAYQIDVDRLRTATGESLDPDAVASRLRERRPRVFFLTASETSVGVKNDLERLAKIAREVSPETLIACDAITALGAFRFESEAWGIDAVVCGSQKALSLPPGLAFVYLSARAREAARASRLPKYYGNLLRELDKQAAGETAFTPAITLVVGLAASLRRFREMTMEVAWQDAARRSAMTRAGLAALGIGLVPKGGASESVTAAWVPPGLDGEQLLKDLAASHGIKIAGGQGELKGKIFRIAHFGPLEDTDMLDCLTGIESVLARSAGSHRDGAAASAAEAAASAIRGLP